VTHLLAPWVKGLSKLEIGRTYFRLWHLLGACFFGVHLCFAAARAHALLLKACYSFRTIGCRSTLQAEPWCAQYLLLNSGWLDWQEHVAFHGKYRYCDSSLLDANILWSLNSIFEDSNAPDIIEQSTLNAGHTYTFCRNQNLELRAGEEHGADELLLNWTLWKYLKEDIGLSVAAAILAPLWFTSTKDLS
jgi:hypothetical protein